MKKFMNLKNQMIITIEQDDNTTSPRNWDNLGTFYTWNSGYYSPDNSPIYIVNTGIGYVVITNLFGYTFREKFKTKEEALDYYKRKKVNK